LAVPGGYEVWHFDADDAADRFGLSTRFMLGSWVNGQYSQKLQAYLSHPTRLSPPLPEQYPAVRLEVFEDEKPAGGFTAALKAEEFSAASGAVQLNFGRNWVRPSGSAIQVHLEDDAQPIRADLLYQPLWPAGPVEMDFGAGPKQRPLHRWVLADPICQVTASIALGQRKIEFSGRGCRTHNYGTAALGNGLRQLFQGRAIGQDLAAVFQIAGPADSSGPQVVQLQLLAPDGGNRQLAGQATGRWRRHRWLGCKYPSHLLIDGGGKSAGKLLELSRPRIIPVAGAELEMLYDAVLEGRPAKAWCRLSCPRRPWRKSLSWSSRHRISQAMQW